MPSIDLVVIGVIVVLQFAFFIYAYARSTELAELFPDFADRVRAPLGVATRRVDPTTGETTKLPPRAPESEHGRSVELLDVRSSSNISDRFRKIVNVTNDYLKSVVGLPADFEIVRDVADRVSDTIEDSASSAVSTPLYLGLMGTFLGVIIGLVNITAHGTIDDESINAFLGGVFVAMTASLFGLLLTTINNNFVFRRAKTQCDERKNDYFSFLQSRLMPLASRDSTNVVSALKTNLAEFNHEFSTNINAFQGTIGNLTENMRLQKEFLDTLDRLGYERMVRASAETFERIDESAERFREFADYSRKLSDALRVSGDAAKKIDSLLDRVSEFEDAIRGLSKNVAHSDVVSGELLKFIGAKLEAIKRRSELVTSFVDTTDDEISRYLEEEKQSLRALTQSAKREIESSFRESGKENAFSNLRLLEKLSKLEDIDRRLEQIAAGSMGGAPASGAASPALLEALNLTITQLERLNEKIAPSIFRPVQFVKFLFGRRRYG